MLAIASVALLWSTERAEAASSESEQAPLAIVPPLVHGSRGRQQIALTFDLGADLGALPVLLDTLHSEKVQVTFFLTGKWAESYPAWARHIVTDGHELGNHSWDHRDHRKLTSAEIREEIRQAERTIFSITGRSSRPYWRAPYGEEDLRVLREVSRAGFVPVSWSLDSLDSVGEPKSAAYLVNRIISRPPGELDGAIVLFHAAEPATAEAVRVLLPKLRRNHLQVVPLSRLLAPASHDPE